MDAQFDHIRRTVRHEHHRQVAQRDRACATAGLFDWTTGALVIVHFDLFRTCLDIRTGVAYGSDLERAPGKPAGDGCSPGREPIAAAEMESSNLLRMSIMRLLWLPVYKISCSLKTF